MSTRKNQRTRKEPPKKRNPIARHMNTFNSPKVFRGRRNELIAKEADKELDEFLKRGDF